MREKIALVTAGGHISSFHAAMKRMCEVVQEQGRGRPGRTVRRAV